MRRLIPVLLAVVFGGGCAHLISDSLRGQVNINLPLKQLFNTPEKFQDSRVMLGGVIVKTNNFPGRTEIELVEKELDHLGYPDRGDISLGRFIFVRQEFLDPQIYAKGRYVVGVGRVESAREGKIDQQPYRYPVVFAEEFHLLQNYSSPPNRGTYYGPLGPGFRRGSFGLLFPYNSYFW
tara:strand:+ start:2070 stop:2606 length:537 start_codon:yes stop_codon:yes gene_type:complete